MVSDRPVNNCQVEQVVAIRGTRGSQASGYDSAFFLYASPVSLRPTYFATNMTDESRTATCMAEWPELAARALKEDSRGDWTGDALALYGVLLDNESHLHERRVWPQAGGRSHARSPAKVHV